MTIVTIEIIVTGVMVERAVMAVRVDTGSCDS